MSESVARRLAAPPPHCVAEWRVSGFNGQEKGFENLNCRRGPWSLFACLLHPPHPHSAKQGKGTAFGDQCIVAIVFVPQTKVITNVRLSCLLPGAEDVLMETALASLALGPETAKLRFKSS